MTEIEYPFVPKSSAKLQPGQFWGIPLSDGRFACGRVMAAIPKGESGSNTSFIAGLLDWVDTEPPSEESIAGAKLLETGQAHVRAITSTSSQILGERDLKLDKLEAPSHITSYYGDAAMQARAEFVLVLGSPLPTFERRNVGHPLKRSQLKPFTTPGVVQCGELSTRDMKRLAKFLESQEDVGLRVFGSRETVDLEFLQWFPNLTDLTVDNLYELKSLDGLRHLPSNMRSLGIGDSRKKLDLAVIERFTELRSLHIEGAKTNIEVIGSFTSLEELSLRSVTLPDLSTLTSLHGLRSLELKLGGTKDLDLLPQVGKLEHLEIWQVKGLTDLSPIADLKHLRYLFLETLNHVESLPDLRGLEVLERLQISGMKLLKSIEPISRAPNIRHLVLSAPQLRVPDMEALIDHPTLESASIGLGSVKRNDEVSELLGLPDVWGYKPGWREICDT